MLHLQGSSLSRALLLLAAMLLSAGLGGCVVRASGPTMRSPAVVVRPAPRPRAVVVRAPRPRPVVVTPPRPGTVVVTPPRSGTVVVRPY